MGDRGDKITSLSGGNQQKVLIGRAFALSPNILILNDPARGVDIGAKTDLYAHLGDFAAAGKSVVYMSSEIEELIGFCSRVLVFRNGHIFEELVGDAINGDRILAAMFGQHSISRSAPRGGEARHAEPRGGELLRVRVSTMSDAGSTKGDPDRALQPFALRSPAFSDGGAIPDRFAEASRISPPLEWCDPPDGALSYALTVTDPDLPPELGFPRAFAHWLVADIPADVSGLLENASGTPALPREAREFASDFVTFLIPGYGRGYGGPWPPDDAHRYVFTLYALKIERVELEDSADYLEFVRAVLPATITTATLVGVYGPASMPLPSAA